MFDLSLIQHCANGVDYPVAHAIVKQESAFNPFAIGVNKGGKPVKQPKNYSQAVATAKQLLAAGHNIDLGLAQINSSNLKWLNLSVEQAFKPCENLKAMQTVYLDCLNRTGENGLGTKMQRALSCYNTGNMRLGFKNGYVNKVTQHFNNFINSSGANGKSFLANTVPTKNNDLAVYATTLNSKPSGEIKSDDINNGEEVAQDIPVRVKNSWDVFGDF